MAKKKEPEKQGNEELFLALNLLEKEKGIPVEFMLDKIKKAISTACKNNYGNEDVDIDVNPEKGVFNVYLRKEIVEEVEDPNASTCWIRPSRWTPPPAWAGLCASSWTPSSSAVWLPRPPGTSSARASATASEAR